MQVIELGVLEFLGLTLRVGGLCADVAARGVAAMGLGQAAHQGLAARRPEGYQREVGIRHTFDWEDYRLIIGGRIDGLQESDSELLVEELKTISRPLATVNAETNPFHLAQLRLYHHFLAVQRPDLHIVPVLTYLNPHTLEERSFQQAWDRDASQRFFEELAIRYLRKLADRQRWLATRDASIAHMNFPFPEPRPGQRELMEAVVQAIRGQQDLLAEAATGIGKTIGVLYPAIVCLPHGLGYTRIFYLTAKSAGAEIVRKTLSALRAQGLRLRVLYLSAKDRICPLAGPDKPECDGRECAYATDFYARQHEAMQALLAFDEWTPELIAGVAERETLCPFELSLELALAADLVICDYNYAFDPSVFLRRFFAEGLPNDSLFLVDEAHNLVTRGREMYSATLTEKMLREVEELAKEAGYVPVSLKPLHALFAAWRNDLRQEDAQAIQLPALPDDFALLLDGLLDALVAVIAAMPRGPRRLLLLERYFELLHCSRIAAGITPDYALYVAAEGRSLRLRLFCPHPGMQLRRRLERSATTVFLSATLSPARYFADLLGAREGAQALALPCPFPRENRLYLHVPGISTKYTARDATTPSVAQVILRTARAHAGNYLAFFPSYAYLSAAWAEITMQKPDDVKLYAQQPGMSVARQAEFLRAVCLPGAGTRVGLAVMGGLFGEAVDLPGEQLVGVILVGPGLPGLSPEQELISDYFNERSGEGFLYASVVPGIIRVIQAAGRVFRTPDDRGVVILLDDRFLENPYRDLLPPDWDVVDPDFSTAEYEAVLAAFWGDGRRPAGKRTSPVGREIRNVGVDDDWADDIASF